MDHPTSLTHLRWAAARFADVLRTGDLAAPVPTCGDWRLRDLGHHLGQVHRWARTAIPGPPAESEEDIPVPGSPERAALVDWFVEGASALVEALAAAGPGAPCWTFGPEPRVAGFWSRRQAHETAVHAVDAELSQGPPGPVPHELARDGVDEVVSLFLPRQVRMGRTVLPGARIALVTGDGTRWEIGGPDAPVDAVVTGPAEALYLLLWRRTGLGDPRLSVDGDRSRAGIVLAADLTP